jgi:uncharacterized protein YjbI with pentapeptide repeats
MPQDFSHKNLRGRNFKGQDLTGANFMGADIRGADFTNAILIEADFTRAKAGLQRRRTIFLVTISLFLSLISGLMSALAGFWVAVFFTPDNIKQYTIFPGVVVLIVVAIFFIATIRQGIGTAAGAVVVAVAGAVAVVAAGAAAGLGIYIAWRALAGDEKHAFVRKIAIAFATTGGTSFRNADLTDANFTKATLKSTDFRTANLTRTCFRNTERLDRARVGNSILADTRVRELLITGNGYKKSYVGADLQGANLTGVNLNEANLKQANLSKATLHQADLELANLTETQALATDFTEAYFTGACLESWNIDANTKLDRVDCRFVYLLENAKPGTDDRERRPSSGEFRRGVFTKLFEEVLTTVDLIFDKGIDWKAFVTAFKKVQVENEGTELAIQIIENKGDGVVVVRVSVPTDANKEKIHSEFTQNYQLAIKELDKYKELYEYQRKIYSDMHEIVKLLASQSPQVNVNNEVKSTSESNPVQETNQYNIDTTVSSSKIGTNHGTQIATQLNYAAEQNLAKAAEDIEKLQFNTETTQIEEKTKHLERPKFSVVYPENISYDKWHSLYFFMYSQELSEIVKTKINKLAKITKISGWNYEKNSSIFSSVIPEGSLVEISWFSEEVKVNPEKISFNWFENFQEFNFRIKCQESKEINEKRNLGLLDYVYLRIDISVNTLPVIFPIILTIGIGNTQDSKISTIDLGLIETIFASYSEADDEVVEDFKEKYEAIGISMFTEAIPYRNAGVRDQALQKLFGIIESSDIFQLFWSSSAQQCEGVKIETAKAIELIQDGKKHNFFRGVYWEEQFPELPPGMVGMPFSKLPRLRAHRKEKANLEKAIEREAARPIANITNTAIAESTSAPDSFHIDQRHAVHPSTAIAKDQAKQQVNISSVTSEPQCTPEQILVQNLLRKLRQFIKPLAKKIGLIVKSLLNFR